MDDLTSLYTGFDGRLNRAAYWLGSLILGIVGFLIQLGIGALLGVSIMAPDFRFRLFSLVLTLLLLYPVVALMVKRLHDRDRPMWLAGVFLAPNLIKALTNLMGLTGTGHGVTKLDIPLVFLDMVIFLWAFIELGCLRGTVGTNQYGPDPLASRAVHDAEPTRRRECEADRCVAPLRD
jgi:uncharacterized membrane protein YhaH (DUF805 family)